MKTPFAPPPLPSLPPHFHLFIPSLIILHPPHTHAHTLLSCVVLHLLPLPSSELSSHHLLLFLFFTAAPLTLCPLPRLPLFLSPSLSLFSPLSLSFSSSSPCFCLSLSPPFQTCFLQFLFFFPGMDFLFYPPPP